MSLRAFPGTLLLLCTSSHHAGLEELLKRRSSALKFSERLTADPLAEPRPVSIDAFDLGTREVHVTLHLDSNTALVIEIKPLL